jgi:hypothetical protein
MGSPRIRLGAPNALRVLRSQATDSVEPSLRNLETRRGNVSWRGKRSRLLSRAAGRQTRTLRRAALALYVLALIAFG